MDIFHSAKDLRVVIQTPESIVLDARVERVEARDHFGALALDNTSAPMLTALIPGDIVVHKRDGTTIRIRAGRGSLTSVGNQVRIATSRARVTCGSKTDRDYDSDRDYDVAV